MEEREDMVRDEMRRWGNVMERLRGLLEKGEFTPNCHDLGGG